MNHFLAKGDYYAAVLRAYSEVLLDSPAIMSINSSARTSIRTDLTNQLVELKAMGERGEEALSRAEFVSFSH